MHCVRRTPEITPRVSYMVLAEQPRVDGRIPRDAQFGWFLTSQGNQLLHDGSTAVCGLVQLARAACRSPPPVPLRCMMLLHESAAKSRQPRHACRVVSAFGTLLYLTERRQ